MIGLAILAAFGPFADPSIVDQIGRACVEVAEPTINERSVRGTIAVGPTCIWNRSGSASCEIGPLEPAAAEAVLRATNAPSLEFATTPVWGSHLIVELARWPNCDWSTEPESCLRLLSEKAGKVGPPDTIAPPITCHWNPDDLDKYCEARYDNAEIYQLYDAMDWSAEYTLRVDTHPGKVVGDLVLSETTWQVVARSDDRLVFEATNLDIEAITHRGERRTSSRRVGSCGPFADRPPVIVIEGVE